MEPELVHLHIYSVLSKLWPDCRGHGLDLQRITLWKEQETWRQCLAPMLGADALRAPSNELVARRA